MPCIRDKKERVLCMAKTTAETERRKHEADI